MQESERVSPRNFRGLRDPLPREMAARQWMVERIRYVYELYGFLPLETPGLEYFDVLTGPAGSEASDSLFRVRNPGDPLDKLRSDRLGLRFDLAAC